VQLGRCTVEADDARGGHLASAERPSDLDPTDDEHPFTLGCYALQRIALHLHDWFASLLLISTGDRFITRDRISGATWSTAITRPC
jgi:hypothetical protein